MAHYPENSPATSSRMHPLLVTAIVSFIALCAVGIAVLTGMLPSPLARTVDRPPASVALAEEAAKADKAAEEARIAADQVRAAADDAARKEAALQAPRAPAAAPPPVALAVAPTPAPAPMAAVCNNCGVVQSVTSYQIRGEGTGLGAIAGGVLGGVVGNQFGGGNGRTALTLLGAGGGAYAGHEVEKNVRTNTRYQMKVRMNDGSVKTYTSASPYGWRNGDPVRVVNGQVVARNAG